MRLKFRSVSEDLPGPKWREKFGWSWPAYSAWFLSEGEGARPGYLTCQKQLEKHMPELVPTWLRLTELGGGSDQVARMLSLYNPAPYLAGCSQALWTRGEPALVRNYDYHPGRCEGLLLMSNWHGTRVIAVSDSLWGYTPKHASWLDQAEIEIGIFSRQCLGRRRINSLESLRKEARAWNRRMNRVKAKIDWRFTVKDARRKFRYKRSRGKINLSRN